MKTYFVDLPETCPPWNQTAFVAQQGSVPYVLVWNALVRSCLPKLEIALHLNFEDKELSVSIPDLLIPALLVLLGTDSNKCIYPELNGAKFECDGISYKLGYVHDPEEPSYGWYIIAL